MNDDIFCWSDGFAIGPDIVGDQHRKLVSFPNQLAQIHPSKAGDTDLLRVSGQTFTSTRTTVK